MSHGRRSGESLNRSRFSACSASGQAGVLDEARASGTSNSNGGGGLFSFLKTELDSFVKGLSGKSDELPPLPAQAQRDSGAARKRQKRSHEDPPGSLSERDLELDAIQGRLGRRLSNQDYAPLTQANLRLSISQERLDRVRTLSQDAPPRASTSKSRPSLDPQEMSAAHSSYYATSPLPFPANGSMSPPRRSDAHTLDLQDLTSPERRRRKRERAATFVNDEEARLQLQKQLQEQEAAAKYEERAQKRREKESRDARRRNERREALARLQAQEATEDQARATRMLPSASATPEQTSYMRLEDSAAQTEQRRRRESARSEEAAKEARRVAELEAEIDRLRRELEEAKAARTQEDQASIASRHVHFAPTPPLLDAPPAEVSFLSVSSSNSSIPAPPPPPPPASEKPKHTVTSLLAARRAAGQSKPPKKPASGVGMPLDMGKFLHEMKTAKLRKVGLPEEGAKKAKRDEEEHGIKNVLEAVLRKRFHANERTSDATGASSSLPSLTSRSTRSQSQLSASTSSSITSFSSYRPPDWSMDMDPPAMAVPPPRKSSLGDALRAEQARKDAQVAAAAGHARSQSATSLPITIQRPPNMLLQGFAKQSRTLSQPSVQSTPMQRAHRRTNSAGTAGRQNSLLVRPHIRPQLGFGHALTSEETQQAGKVPSKPYALPRTSWTPHHAAQSRSSFGAIRGLPQPSTCGTVRTRKISNNSDETTVKSTRSAGSSFDIDIYGQMQIGGSIQPEIVVDNMEVDAELAVSKKRSFEEPVDTSGTMDLLPPEPLRSIRHVASMPKRPQVTRIPTLRFSNTPLVEVSEFAKTSTEPSGLLGLQATRPGALQARKVSDYKYPRAAPLPPGGGAHSNGKRSREPHSSRTLGADDEEMIAQAEELDEEEVSLVLEGEESFLAGFGQR